MPKIYQSDPYFAKQKRYAIIVARYNATITDKLLDGAVQTLLQAGVADDCIDVFPVPGAWEIPVVVRHLIFSGRYSAVICLGAVIRGETTHDEHINRQVSLSLGALSLWTGLPILFGVLTVQNLEQALQRAGGTQGNKGAECAAAALEMVGLLPKIPTQLTTLGENFQSAVNSLFGSTPPPSPFTKPPMPDGQ